MLLIVSFGYDYQYIEYQELVHIVYIINITRLVDGRQVCARTVPGTGRYILPTAAIPHKGSTLTRHDTTLSKIVNSIDIFFQFIPRCPINNDFAASMDNPSYACTYMHHSTDSVFACMSLKYFECF